MESSTRALGRPRLQITRPALYYHYKSKEDILASIHRDLALSIDDIIAWTRSQPAGWQTRIEVLHQLAALMAGRWGQFTRFAQANEAAMRHLTAAAEFIERIDTLAELLRPANTAARRYSSIRTTRPGDAALHHGRIAP